MAKIKVVVSYEVEVDLSTPSLREFWQAEDVHQALHTFDSWIKDGSFDPTEDLDFCPYKVESIEVLEE